MILTQSRGVLVSCRATVATGSASGFYPRTACRKSKGSPNLKPAI